MEIKTKSLTVGGIIMVLMLVISFFFGGVFSIGNDSSAETMKEVMKEAFGELLEEWFYDHGPIMTRTAYALNCMENKEDVKAAADEWHENRWTLQVGDMYWFKENPNAFKYLEDRVGYSAVFEEYKSLCLRL